MNRWHRTVGAAALGFEGPVPSPFAIYRAPIVNGGSMLPFEVGICSYEITDLDTFRSRDELTDYEAQLVARVNELEAEYGVKPFNAEHREEWAAIRDARESIASRLREIDERKAYIDSMAHAGRVEEPKRYDVPNVAKSKLPDNLHDLNEYRSRTSSEEAMIALQRDGARKAVEGYVFPLAGSTDEKTKAHIFALLERLDGGDPDQGVPAGSLSRRILATGSPIYRRAFAKFISGHMLTPQEQAAISTVGTTTAGGYAVPPQIDTTLILTSDGTVNPLRALARVEQITGNTWKGVTSGGITITRGPAENGAVTPTELALGQPEVTAQPVKAEVQFSIEAGEDWPRLEAEVGRVFQDAKDVEEASSFTNGSGSGLNPEGITQLDESSWVPTADVSAPIALALGDLYNLRGALPPRFRPGAAYLASDFFYGQVRQLGAGQVGDASIWAYGIADGNPDRLLGKPAYEASNMVDAMTEGELLAIYGDFKYFLIVDKIGMTVELDPHVRDGNGKWTGQRALLMHYRNSSKILADNAFRALVAGAVPS